MPMFLLEINRSSLYYQPAPASEEDLELMALMDRQYLRTSLLWLPKDGDLAPVPGV
jgi:hypothetical protein